MPRAWKRVPHWVRLAEVWLGELVEVCSLRSKVYKSTFVPFAQMSRQFYLRH